MEHNCDALFKVIGEVTRRRILVALNMRELSVQELQGVLSLGQSIISAHLAQLKLSGLVDSRRSGRFVLYRLVKGTSEQFDSLMEAVIDMVSNEVWYERDQRKLTELVKRKKEISLSFYEGMSTQNKRHPGQTDISVAIGLLRSIRDKRIIDIGCGNGNLAKEFSLCNKSVLGIDIEEKQIELAREIHCNADTKNLSFIVARGEESGQKDGSADIVIFSQSLHHIQEPQRAIAEAYRILDKEGIIIILDLNKHTEEWVKSIYGDLHFGFEFKVIESWLKKFKFSDITTDINSSDEVYPQFETAIITAVKKRTEK